MASGNDYPRQAAHTLRQGRRAQAEIALMRAQTALEHARGSVVNAVQALQQHGATALRRDAEPGPMSAHTLQREAAYSERHARQARRLRALLLEAQAHEAAATLEYTNAQRLLAEAHAAEQVLERDRERFGITQRKQAVRAEELEAEEQREKGRAPHKH